MGLRDTSMVLEHLDVAVAQCTYYLELLQAEVVTLRSSSSTPHLPSQVVIAMLVHRACSLDVAKLTKQSTYFRDEVMPMLRCSLGVFCQEGLQSISNDGRPLPVVD